MIRWSPNFTFRYPELNIQGRRKRDQRNTGRRPLPATYVTDVQNRPDFRVIRNEFFGPRGPASTMIQVAALAHPDYLIEIEAIAIV